MTVTFRCPSCHTTFRVEDSSFGKTVICPNPACNRKVTLPKAGGANLGIQREAHERAKPPAVKFPAASQEPEALPRTINGTPRSIVMLVAALLLFITVAGALATTVMFFGKGGKPDKFSEIVASTVPADSQQSIEDSKAIEKAIEEKTAREQKAAKEKQRADQLAAEEAEKQIREADMAVAEKAAAGEAARKEAEAKTLADKRALGTDGEKQGPFVFIHNDETRHDSHGQWLFALPKPGEDIEPESLPLSVKDQVVELALCQGAAHLFAGSPYKLKLIQSPDDPNKWIAKANEIELAEYTIEPIDSASDAEGFPDRQVHFQWLPGSSREIEASELLRWWPLQIRVGDRSAVLLQKKAVFLSTPLSWKTLLASKDFIFPKSDELNAVAFDQASHMSFDLEITEADHEPQEFTLKIGAEEEPVAAEIPADGDADPDADDRPGTAVRYFSLTLPLKFVEAPPSDADSPLGFGTLKIRLSYAADKGLIFRPKTSITVQLPKQDFLDSLPSRGLLDELSNLNKDPRRFMNIVPKMEEIVVEAKQEMKANAEAMRAEVVNWHTQSLTTLLGKKSFDSTFKTRAKAAISTIDGVIPYLDIALKTAEKNLHSFDPRDNPNVLPREKQTELASLKRNVQTAQAAYDSASKYAPDVENFKREIDQLILDVDREIEILMQDYDAISTRVQEFVEPAQQRQFEVQCELSGLVETPGNDNGNTLRVYFLESFSHVAP